MSTSPIDSAPGLVRSPLDAAPADGLERAFLLPPHVAADEGLLALHTEMVTRLRREAQGLPMNTLQQILIERIAGLYTQIKFKEEHQSFSANQQREFNTYFLDLTKEFNRLLQASDDKLREAMLNDIEKVFLEAVDLIQDDNNRRDVRRHVQEGLAAIGQ